MIYTAKIDTPKNTSKSSPKRTKLDICKGLVYQVEFLFPPGCAGLTGVCVCDGGHQLWPSTSGEFFETEGETISFMDTYLKLVSPWHFDIFTYNSDDTYSHACHVRIGMVAKEIFMARFLPTYTYDHFISLLKQMEEEQRARSEAEASEILSNPFPWLRGEEEES